MASRTSPRLASFAVSLLLVSACGDPRDAAGSRAGHSLHGNYGEDRIGYKGSALSSAGALSGDEREDSASVAGAFAAPGGAGAPSPTGFSGAGGSVAGGTVGATIGDLGSAPPQTVMDAGSALVGDAALRDARGADTAGDAQSDAAEASVTGAIDASAEPTGDARADEDGSASGDTSAVADASAPGQELRDASVHEPDARVVALGPNASADAGTPEASARPAATPTASPSGEVTPENPFHLTRDEATSTFAIDVDTGSYTLSRASILDGHLPAPKSVRIEEFLNYFHFHYAQPEGDAPLSVYTEIGDCPWNAERKLLMVGIQGQEVELADQPPANLVFLIDVSGSMNAPDKLPLLKKGFRMLTSQLRPQDRVAIVTYAGLESVALTSTPGDQKSLILGAIDRLEAGGSTNGAGGIQKAYELAQQTFMKDGNNRVILATDGDFNVGIRAIDELKSLIAAKRATGVYLSVYGFGDAWDGGNYKDEVGEQLANNGDGFYFYVDSPEEARRAFLESVSGSLLTVAKDVKVQLELNPDHVKAYRLIGYENRVLANTAFSNDAVDGGELGAGLSVTALFELIPANAPGDVPSPVPGSVPELAGAGAQDPSSAEAFEPLANDDWVEVRLRYKRRAASESTLVRSRYGEEIELERPTPKFSFAAGVSELAMQLRRSQYLPVQRREELLAQLAEAKRLDRDGAIAELIQLAMKAHALSR